MYSFMVVTSMTIKPKNIPPAKRAAGAVDVLITTKEMGATGEPNPQVYVTVNGSNVPVMQNYGGRSTGVAIRHQGQDEGYYTSEILFPSNGTYTICAISSVSGNKTCQTVTVRGGGVSVSKPYDFDMFDTVVDVNGTIAKWTAAYGASVCWGLNASNGTTYIFIDAPDPQWQIEGTPVRVIGNQVDRPTVPCATAVPGAAWGLDVTSIQSAQGGCSAGDAKCIGTDNWVCVGGVWQNQGCNAICGGQCGGGNPPVASNLLPALVVAAIGAGAIYYLFFKK